VVKKGGRKISGTDGNVTSFDACISLSLSFPSVHSCMESERWGQREEKI
jgi:hypothetical protein